MSLPKGLLTDLSTFYFLSEKGQDSMINLGKLSPNGKEVILKKKKNGCIECISHCKDNCGYTRIFINGKHQRLFRYIYEKKYGEIPKNMVIRHKCDNPNCCNIEHLELGTQKENYNDFVTRHPKKNKERNKKISVNIRGENAGSSKLNKKEVKEIYISDLSDTLLAKKYNISRSDVWQIKNKKIWNWYTKNLD